MSRHLSLLYSLFLALFVLIPSYSHANTTLLHEFAGGAEDGQYPEGSLVLNASSTFFGVTTEGGDAGRGAIFSMHITGAAVTLLHEFAGGAEDGQQPEGPLTLDGTTLYGVTSQGGDDNLGTVFSIQTNGAGFTILHEFSGGTDDGQYPEGSLVLNGTTLYGVTSQGGDDNLGTVFSIQTNGAGFTILHEFSGGTDDGALPDDSSLVIDGTTLYGVTYAGGDDNKGTVFSIQTNGTGFTILHEFSGGTDDGSWPTGALTLDVDGIYGVTIGGGYDLVGTIFYINTDGTGFTLLHEFAGGTDDGDTPGGAFTLDGETLYGVTRYGGDSNWGTVFSFPADTPPTYTINTSINPAGAGTVSCTQNPVPEGENSTCTATPNAGYTFSAWSGDCVGATCSLTNVTSSKSVTAQFTQNSYTVTATAGANGTIDPASRSVTHGNTTTFTVTPNSGYSASATGCNGALSGTTYTTGAVTGACTVTASFTRTSSGGGGSGSSSSKKAPTLIFTASPKSIASGQSSTLTWKSTNATKCVASNDWSGSKSLSSSQTVSPTKTATYTLACTGAGGTVTKSVTVNVAKPVATLTLTASPTSVVKGNTSTLVWKSTNTSTCMATGGGLFSGWFGLKSPSGSQVVTVTTPTTYTLACVGIGGTTTKSVTVGITPPPAPTITLTASPTTIAKGGKSTLTWKSTNATACLAAGGWGNPIDLSGTRSVSPTKTTTYTLACTGAGGNVTKNVTVTVTPVVAQNNPILPIDKNLGKWFALTYPNHERFEGTHYWYQFSAVDFNLDLPNRDADNGKTVRAIQSGNVTKNSDGFLVIKHDVPLTLENGTVIKEWYSHYGHMSNHQVSKGTIVKKGDPIGKISRVGADNNHLHFSIYRSEVSDKSNAISPYWLPGDYRDRTLYADTACWDDSKCIREPAGLYDSRIFTPTPKK